MALANVTYTGDGSTTNFTITFAYLDRTHIAVSVDGVDTTDVSSLYQFSFVDDTHVLITAIAGGVAVASTIPIKISRVTPTASSATTFADGAVVRASALNSNTDQLLYIAQEVKDQDISRMGLASDDKFDAQSKVIKNVANPVNAQDAATKHYLENTWLSAADKAQLNSLNLTNLNTVAARNADIVTVAARDADIGTVAARDANIGTVAARDANIGTVASRDADIATVAARDANIGTVAARDVNIGTVAARDADIAALADIEDGTTATDAISGLAAIKANVTTAAGIAGNITTVAGISSNVTTVAGMSSADITTVAGINADVTTAAGISADITTVAGMSSADITTVAGISANVTTVAGIDANVTTVAGIASDVTAAATNATDISAIAAEVAKVVTVANDLNEATSEIDVVANSITNVNAVGTDIANVNTVASNLTNVNSFADTYFIGSTAPSSPTAGDLWFDTSVGVDTMKVYGASGWQNAGSSVNGTSQRTTYTATAGQTTFAAIYDAGYIDVYLNGIKLIVGTDVTATSGTNIVLATGAAAGDTLETVAFGTFSISNFSINDANDVAASGATNGQFLQYNGSNWVGGTVSTPTLSSLSIANHDQVTVTAGGAVTATSYAGDGSALTGVEAFASGTKMLFGQTAAPTGWTKITTDDDAALRIVSGTVGSGGSSGLSTALATPTVTGTIAGSTGAHTLTTSQMPSHQHALSSTNFLNNGGNGSTGAQPNRQNNTINITSEARGTRPNGGGGSHSHSLSATFSGGTAAINVKYVDVIMASKD